MKQAKSTVKRAGDSQKRIAAVQGAPGEVRIISGKWRGRKLAVLNADGLRPTTDRVKETLFNWLMHDIDGAVVLDCFAGSGSLAFEALSRHASAATLIERDSALARHLQQNLHKLQCDNATVVAQDCLTFLSHSANTQYNVVFIDPPFRKDLAITCCQALEQQQWLAEDALIYIETEKELNLSALPANWRLLKEKVAGQLAYRLYQRG
jgi:16S rRNA (guanine966-N2)-methyltransferase